MEPFLIGKLILFKLTLVILIIGAFIFTIRKNKGNFLKFDKLNVEEELKNKNTAVAIIIAAGFIAFSIIVVGILITPFAAHADTCSGLNLTKNIYMPANAKVVNKTDKAGVCQVTIKIRNYMGQDQYLPVYATKKFVLVGTMFINKKNVTDGLITRLREKQIKQNLADAKPYFKYDFAEYKPKNANGKSLYVFVDPLCPFCHEIEPYLKGLANKSGYAVKMYFMIVHGKPAYKDALGFACSGKGFSSYIHDAKNLKYGTGSCATGKNLLKMDAKLDAVFTVSGTPTFITSGGKEVVGANLNGIRQMLGLNPIVPKSVKVKPLFKK